MSIPEYVLITRKKLAEMEYVCADTADRLKEVGDTLTGSKAIGHETMESAFRQMSKVVRNYMRAVDREIEDHSPGTVDDIYAALERMEQVSAKLKDRPEAPEPEPEEVIPDEIKQAFNEAGIDWRDSREAVSEALIAKYRYYKGAAEYARNNGTFDGRGVIYWEKKAEGIDDATVWNRARKVETL